MSEIEMCVTNRETKEEVYVTVTREPQDGSWLHLCVDGRWYRGHVTNLIYMYESPGADDEGEELTETVVVEIDAVTWGVTDAELQSKGGEADVSHSG